MLTALDSGALESTRKKADERFGHGRIHGNYAVLDERDMSYYSSGMHLPERATVDSQVHPAPRALHTS